MKKANYIELGCDMCGEVFDDLKYSENDECSLCGVGILLYDYISIYNEDKVKKTYNDFFID